MRQAMMSALVLVLSLMASTSAPAFQTTSPVDHAQDCGCEDKPELHVLAIVNGRKITKQDLSVNTRTQVSLLQETVIDARSRELDRLINSLLLEAEAKKRGLSTFKLLQLEVSEKIIPPTDAEAQAFYQRNKARIPQNFKAVKNNVISHLRSERELAQSAVFAAALRAAANVSVLVQTITPPANETEKSRVFATVNGIDITSRDIEESLLPLIFRIQEQVYSYRKADLDLKINDVLLEQEAKRQGLLPLALLDKEVRTKLSVITEEQARSFYKENEQQMRGGFARYRGSIMQYLMAQEERRVTLAYAEQLRIRASLQIYLTAPESPSFKIAIDDQPIRGNPQAMVTVVQFTDFESQPCARQYEILERVMAEFGSQLRLVIRDFPLAQNPNAVRAAEAAEAAREQAKYWEYIALLYKNQSALQVDNLKQYASALGLDRARFDAALDSGLFNSQVRRDIADGERLSISSPPTIFVNGRRISDYSYEGLKAAIQAALKQAGSKSETHNPGHQNGF